MSGPPLPAPRGPLSEAVGGALRGKPLPVVDADGADPYGDDLQLALHCCYELHYRGFDGVDADLEWDPDLLRLRVDLERVFLAALRADVEPSADVDAEIEALLVEPVGPDLRGLSHHLKREGTLEQLRESVTHRSVYHLKEADPQAWAIPRLSGQAKASFVAVEFDEFGAGRGARVHQQLFADLLDAADLDSTYLGYLDDVPAPTLAVVNLMSLFGLHRRLRGAAVGHFAATEVTSPPGSRRMVQALERLDAPEPCRAFYAEHVEADAVHEQVVRTDVVGDLVAREPELDADVVFGIRAFDVVETRLADHLMECWQTGTPSLRREIA